MKNKIKETYKYLLTAILLYFLLSFNYVFAGILNPGTVTEIGKQNTSFTGTAGFDASIRVGDVMGYIIKGFLGLLGIIFIVLIIYAGYTWMNAGGNEEKITKAKDTIQKAIIGLIIIIAAYSITYFVFEHLPW